MSQVTIHETKTGGLTTNIPSYYAEYQVINYTNRPIGIIDRTGRKDVLKPSSSGVKHNPHVEIQRRGGMGLRVNGYGNHEMMDATVTAIPEEVFMSEPYLATEVDLVICPADLIDKTPHPGAAETYDSVLKNEIYDIVRNDYSPTLRVFANDPSGKVRRFFWHFLGSDVEVPVTCYPTREAGVTFVLSHYGKPNLMQTYSLDQIDNEDGYIDLGTGFVLHVAINQQTVRMGLSAIREKFNGTTKDLDAYVESERKKWVEEHRGEILAFEKKVKELEATIQDLRLDNTSLKTKLNEKEALIAQWSGIHKFQTEALRTDRAQKAVDTEVERTKKASAGATTERFKLGTTLASAAVTATVAVVSTLAAVGIFSSGGGIAAGIGSLFAMFV